MSYGYWRMHVLLAAQLFEKHNGRAQGAPATPRCDQEISKYIDSNLDFSRPHVQFSCAIGLRIIQIDAQGPVMRGVRRNTC